MQRHPSLSTHLLLWIGLLAPLATSCAGRGGLPSVDAAADPERVRAENRQILEAYLAETRDFGPDNSTLAYQVVERGDTLTPVLTTMLGELTDDRDRYQLIRLGCIGIRGGTFAATEPDLRRALDEARADIRLHSDLRRIADAELRHCSAPEGPEVASGEPG